MRAMFTVTASFLIGASLMGCDRNPQAQSPAPVAAAAPVCNCPQQTAAAAPVTTSHSRGHRQHHWSEQESSSYSDSYSPQSEDSDASSSSSASEYDSGAESEQSSSETAHVEAAAWVDGYGRSHYASTAVSDDENPAALTAEDEHRRRAPYHAYNSDCDRR